MDRQSRYEEALQRIYTVLRAIDGNSSLSDISERLKWRRATLYTVLRALESMGFIEIEVSTGIPRKVIPRLTEKGKIFLECLEKVSGTSEK